MTLSKTHRRMTAAAMAGFSVSTGARLEKDPRLPSEKKAARRHGGGKPDPFEGIWESDVVPWLERAPGLRPVTILHELCLRYPQRPLIHPIHEEVAALTLANERRLAMGADPALRQDYDAEKLRDLAKRSNDANAPSGGSGRLFTRHDTPPPQSPSPISKHSSLQSRRLKAAGRMNVALQCLEEPGKVQWTDVIKGRATYEHSAPAPRT